MTCLLSLWKTSTAVIEPGSKLIGTLWATTGYIFSPTLTPSPNSASHSLRFFRFSTASVEGPVNRTTKLYGSLNIHHNVHTFHKLAKKKVTVRSSESIIIRTPERVAIIGQDISIGSFPIANSVCALLVAFMFADSKEPYSLTSSKPQVITTFASPDKILSQAI